MYTLLLISLMDNELIDFSLSDLHGISGVLYTQQVQIGCHRLYLQAINKQTKK